MKLAATRIQCAYEYIQAERISTSIIIFRPDIKALPCVVLDVELLLALPVNQRLCHVNVMQCNVLCQLCVCVCVQRVKKLCERYKVKKGEADCNWKMPARTESRTHSFLYFMADIHFSFDFIAFNFAKSLFSFLFLFLLHAKTVT